MMKLKIYMGYSRLMGPEEGACLVFAHTAKEARKLTFKGFDALTDGDWLDAAATLLEPNDYLYSLANQTKLSAGEPHLIESPPVCGICETWSGDPLNERGNHEDCEEILQDSE